MIVLLIIFMVATSYISGSVRNLPPAGHTRPHPDDPGNVVVALLADRSATVGAAVFKTAEASLPQAEVQRVLDVCRQPGVDEVALITAPRVAGVYR